MRQDEPSCKSLVGLQHALSSPHSRAGGETSASPTLSLSKFLLRVQDEEKMRTCEDLIHLVLCCLGLCCLGLCCLVLSCLVLSCLVLSCLAHLFLSVQALRHSELEGHRGGHLSSESGRERRTRRRRTAGQGRRRWSQRTRRKYENED